LAEDTVLQRAGDLIRYCDDQTLGLGESSKPGPFFVFSISLKTLIDAADEF
jgi:hypothetical protein